MDCSVTGNPSQVDLEESQSPSVCNIAPSLIYLYSKPAVISRDLVQSDGTGKVRQTRLSRLGLLTGFG